VDPIDADAEALLARRLEVVRPSSLDAAELRRAIGGCIGVIVRTTPLRRDVLAAGGRLRVVAKHGTGVDNIDLAAASELDVLVTHCPGENAPAVAEFALTCILLMLKPILPGAAWLRSGRATAPLVAAGQAAGLIGAELGSQTIGVVGWGDIGRRVGLAVSALGARVIAYDPMVGPARIVADGVEPQAQLLDLLAVSDVVTIHVPLTDETRALVGPAELAALKPGASIVNTARGGVVDEDALAAAIGAGRVRSAALDVFAEEPPPADSPLLSSDAVLCTPHMAGSTVDAVRRMGACAVEAVIDVVEGRRPRFVANPEVLERLGGGDAREPKELT
jgi:D-3-phosphoglycerate dehydrogenase